MPGRLGAATPYSTPGIYTITVTLTDDDLGSTPRTTQVIVNSPPTVDAGGPYVGLEGAVLSLTGTAADLDGDGLSISWAFSVTGDPGVVCTPTGTGTLTPTLVCTDDATVTATLTVSDGVNAGRRSTRPRWPSGMPRPGRPLRSRPRVRRRSGAWCRSD